MRALGSWCRAQSWKRLTTSFRDYSSETRAKPPSFLLFGQTFATQIRLRVSGGQEAVASFSNIANCMELEIVASVPVAQVKSSDIAVSRRCVNDKSTVYEKPFRSSCHNRLILKRSECLYTAYEKELICGHNERMPQEFERATKFRCSADR